MTLKGYTNLLKAKSVHLYEYLGDLDTDIKNNIDDIYDTEPAFLDAKLDKLNAYVEEAVKKAIELADELTEMIE